MRADRAARSASSGLPRELKLFWVWTIVLTVLSLLFMGVEHLRHVSPAVYRALSPPGEHFTDFSIYVPKFHYFHSAAFFHKGFPFTYPAPVALVYEAFLRAFAHPTRAFVLFSVLSLVVPAFCFGRALRKRAITGWTAGAFVATLLVCSWPGILVVDRGNMEIIVWISLAAATWALATGRSYWAAALFGLAASMKLFPFVFLALFWSTRRYRELLTGVAVFAVASVAALAVLGPTIPVAFHGISAGLAYFHQDYMARWRPWESGVDHSLFAFVKFVEIGLLHHSTSVPFYRSLRVYTPVTAIGGTVLYFWRIRKLPLLNQLLVLSIACIYLTAFSGDGTLIHLYDSFAPLAFLAIAAWRRDVRVPGLQAALLLLSFVLTYQSFWVVRHTRFEGEVKCVALGILFVIGLRYPFGPVLGTAEDTALLALSDEALPETAVHAE